MDHVMQYSIETENVITRFMTCLMKQG